jgi:uncharacterized protein (TIGR03437 family)
MQAKQFATIFLAVITWATLAPAQPTVTAIVNGASFQSGIPRGCVVSIFGSRLAQSTTSASTLPLPKKLADTVVTVGDLEIEAPLYFVSPVQINAQIPFEALGATLPVFVTTPEGKSKPFVLAVADSGPGIFTQSGDGKGPALTLGSNFQPLDVAAQGKPMIIYAAGLGPTDPPALSGTPGSNAEPLNRVVNVPEVFIGEAPARVDFAGLAPGFAGVYQLNVVPQQLSTDRLFIRSQGQTSNIVSVGHLPGGKNVANASGTIQAIYPKTTDMPGGYSPLLLAAKFTARMDILPSAGPFVIAAVSDAATSIITVDPAKGTFEGTVTVPAIPTRFGDFSDSGITPIDFLTCQQAPAGVTCLPFPGRILPLSRIPPSELIAVNMVPLPDTPIAHSSTGVFKVRGTIRPGSTFLIDEQNNSSLSVFAGYVVIPVPAALTPLGSTGTAALKLFIDGNLVASTEVVYGILPVFEGGGQ